MGEVFFPVAASGRVRRVFGFVDWQRYHAFGGLHPGVDLAAASGAPVYAAAKGEVVTARGGLVVLAHEGWWSVYRGVQPPLPKKGQAVKAGGVIGSVGGREYLHFEVRVRASAIPAEAVGVRAIWTEGVWAVDPLRWLALQMPAPKYCGGVTSFPGVRVRVGPDVHSEQIGFLPQGTPAEGMEQLWAPNGEVWMRLRGVPEMWIPLRLGVDDVEVRPCDG